MTATCTPSPGKRPPHSGTGAPSGAVGAALKGREARCPWFPPEDVVGVFGGFMGWQGGGACWVRGRWAAAGLAMGWARGC